MTPTMTYFNNATPSAETVNDVILAIESINGALCMDRLRQINKDLFNNEKHYSKLWYSILLSEYKTIYNLRFN